MFSAIASKSKILLSASILAVSLSLNATPYAEAKEPLPAYVIEKFGTPPAIPEGPMSKELAEAVSVAFVESMAQGQWGPDQTVALETITKSKDPRVVWLISDLLRFATGARLNSALAGAASDILGKDLNRDNSWGIVTDHLIAWDIPEPPNYIDAKKEIYTAIVPQWKKIFIKGDIDWRYVSWGGVLIDDRAHDRTDDICNCIPAADNPEVTGAEEASWLKDDDIVFGIVLNGEARAYPRQIMEVREMVNDTLGGRDLGIPYCTLCGAAQAYFTDEQPDGVERPILRTSGLLSRSNKVMYDLNTFSVFDTFLGKAVTGPLARKNIHLKQATVVTSDWASWKKAHPKTTVLKEKYALGRNPDFRNGRDANGPIFPIGDVDPRLPVQEDIIGAITTSGKPIAFQRTKALVALQKGQEISFENVKLELDAGGIKAVNSDGGDIGSHQAFWFAWSQFYPKTELWAGNDS